MSRSVGRHDGHLSGAFHRLWGGASAAFVADGVVGAAFPLLALSLTDSPSLIAGIAAVSRASWLASPLIGAAFDRYPRVPLLRQLSGFRTVVGVGVVALWFSGALSLPLLYVAAVLFALAEVAGDIGVQATVPDLVSQPDYDAANRRVIGSELAFRGVLGSPVGAAAATIGPGLPFVIAAGAHYLGRTVLPAPTSVVPRQPYGGRWWSGLTTLRRHRALWNLTVAVGGWNFAAEGALAVLVLHAIAPGQLGLPPAAYGWLLAAYAGGGVAGASLGLAQSSLRMMLLTIAPGLAAGWTALAFAPSAVVAAVGLFLAGAFGAVWRVAASSYRQRRVERELQGRVVAAYRLVGRGSGAAGAAAAAAAVTIVSPATVIGLAAAFVVTIAIMVGLRADDGAATAVVQAP